MLELFPTLTSRQPNVFESLVINAVAGLGLHPSLAQSLNSIELLSVTGFVDSL